MDYLCKSGKTLVVDSMIDKGGMAFVHLGHFEGSTESVVVKFPRKDAPEPAVDLFMNEAEIASQVKHPNVVEILDWGETEQLIVFEYVDGGNLADHLPNLVSGTGGIPLSEFESISGELFSGLLAINEVLIHRDLKPANILVSSSGILKIADFGLAKYIEQSTREKTFKGWGSPGYRSPEVLFDVSVDARTDQLSLGLIFWELLAGKPAFEGADIDTQEMYTNPVRLTNIRSDVQPRLAAAIDRMIRKRVEDRFATLEEAQIEIEASLTGSSTTGDAPGDANGLTNLASLATKVVDTRRQATLEAEKAHNELMQRAEDRNKLFDHEFENLSSELVRQVDEINQQSGEEIISIDVDEREVLVSLENWHLRLKGNPTNLDNSKFMGWGSVEVDGSRVSDPKPYAASHFVMDLNRPFPNWTQVDLPVRNALGGRGHADVGQRDKAGVVIIVSEEGLMNAAAMKGIGHTYTWKEREYSHSEFVREHLECLVRFASSNPN